VKGSDDTAGSVILVIEDDRSLREGLALNLRKDGYEVTEAADGEEGMLKAFDTKPDLIILDIMMPAWSGLDILEELRRREYDVPVLILSARDTTDNKIEGFDLGADDYVTKPFELSELLARVAAMLRRRKVNIRSGPDLSFGDVTIDRESRSVTVAGKQVALSAKEFDLLCLLAGSPGQVFSRDTILERVWGWSYDGTARTVDNFVASLRKKIQRRSGPRYIRTVRQVGYKLVVDGN
jgi:two-component system alkaline phosphatase synthesis response regulator PhoP